MAVPREEQERLVWETERAPRWSSRRTGRTSHQASAAQRRNAGNLLQKAEQICGRTVSRILPRRQQLHHTQGSSLVPYSNNTFLDDFELESFAQEGQKE